jgi:hypothetical protein
VKKKQSMKFATSRHVAITAACLSAAAAACTVAPGPLAGSAADIDAVAIHGDADLCDWTQAFATPTHGGRACPEQRNLRVVQQLMIDPDADQEVADNGFLQIHYGSPLTFSDFVVVPVKRGYGGNGINADGTVSPRPAETWGLQVWHWSPSVTAIGAALSQVWSADTTWEPIDTAIGSFGSYTNGYVQEFGLALANGSVYSLGARATLQRRDLKTGALTSTINPLLGTPFAGDAQTLATSPPSFDPSTGALYYTITAFPVSGRRGEQPRGAWLAVVRPNDATQLVPWSQIAAPSVGVPQAHDPCPYAFGTAGTPRPTGPDSQPPVFGCGAQRPALNVAPTIGDGELIVLSAANNQIGAEFAISLSTSTWRSTAAYDTRFHMATGCGVRLDATSGDCAVITANGTTNLGNDPAFNRLTSFTGSDIMNDAIVLAPNGDLSVSGYDHGFSFGGNYDARGGIVTFRRSLGAGAISVNDDFGWEVTPAVIPHRIIGALSSFTYGTDRNLYSDLVLETAEYGPDWSLRDAASPPLLPTAAVDFLDNQLAIDPAGNRYGLSGDGHLYKFSATGRLLESVPLLGSDGLPRSVETESNHVARDRAGRLYVVWGGSLYVIGGGGSPDGAPAPTAPSASDARRLAIQRAAKRQAAAEAPTPIPLALP